MKDELVKMCHAMFPYMRAMQQRLCQTELELPDNKDLYDFVKSVFENEFYEVLKIENLLPIHVWEYYRNMGKTHLEEQVALNNAKKKLRTKLDERWKNT